MAEVNRLTWTQFIQQGNRPLANDTEFDEHTVDTTATVDDNEPLLPPIPPRMQSAYPPSEASTNDLSFKGKY